MLFKIEVTSVGNSLNERVNDQCKECYVKHNTLDGSGCIQIKVCSVMEAKGTCI